MTLRDLIAPIDELLRQERIRYAVIGGYAVAAWGEVRATQDLDLLCSLADVSRLVKRLERAGLRFDQRTGDRSKEIAFPFLWYGISVPRRRRRRSID